MENKRALEMVVISDVHLGTHGCHANELCAYLKSIRPKTLILNGDIIDIWQFRKSYWPKSHMRVIKEIVNMAINGVEVIYITGNHDEMLRKFAGSKIGGIQILNKKVLEMDGKKMWIFHGDVFDVTMQYSKWLTRLGSVGYDLLIRLNTAVNKFLEGIGRDKISISKKIKNSVKSAVKYINDFEGICAELAVENGYHQVLCGHIHAPEMRTILTKKGQVQYLNSGDWVENLTALEYDQGAWHLFSFFEHFDRNKLSSIQEEELLDHKELFMQLLMEFNMTTAA
jgi:UDP-2,3-diacylglucosamine pyrophosphatase LpxH